MSRSSKAKPHGGWTTAASDKPGKVIDHRRYRKYANDLANVDDWDHIAASKIKEDPYNWPKDGKQYWPEGCRDHKFMGK